MKDFNMNKHFNKAFTLVEILVVCSVAALFIGTLVLLFTNVTRGYGRAEGEAVLLQKSALFIARLRDDLNNAVIAPDENYQTAILQSSDRLLFNIYCSSERGVLPVAYSYYPDPNGGRITRKQGSDNERTLIQESVATLAWQLDIQKYETIGTNTVRMALEVDFALQASGRLSKPFEFKTLIFPARLNRQINYK